MPTPTSMKRPLLAAATSFALALAATSAAAFDLFLRVDGINGESADLRHRNEIDVLSWNWGVVPRDASRPTRGGCVPDITLTKFVDRSTPPLFMAAALGTTIGKATLTVRKPGLQALEFFTIDLGQVQVSSMEQGVADGQSGFVDRVTLRASSIVVSYRPQQADGSLGTPITASLSAGC